jgi:hypothetical protein
MARTCSLRTTRPAGKPARSAGQRRPRHGLLGLRVARRYRPSHEAVRSPRNFGKPAKNGTSEGSDRPGLGHFLARGRLTYALTRRAVSQVPQPAWEVVPSHVPGNAFNTSAGGR